MTGPWRSPRGSIAFTGMMGLVLLSLLLVTASGLWNRTVSAGAGSHAAGPVWEAGAGTAELTSLPPQGTNVREHHVLSFWPPARGERQSEAAHPALLPAPGAHTDAVRDPQRLAHRVTGSRGPPLS